MLIYRQLTQAHYEGKKEIVKQECVKYGKIVSLDDKETCLGFHRKYVIIHLSCVWVIAMLNGSVTKIEQFNV